jgi:hypothetical protein
VWRAAAITAARRHVGSVVLPFDRESILKDRQFDPNIIPIIPSISGFNGNAGLALSPP